MKKDIEAIEKKIEALEAEQAATLKAAATEKQELREKIKELQERKSKPANLDDFKNASQELKSTAEYLDYLIAQENKANKQMLDIDTCNEMRAQIREEIRERQEQAAPELQKKFFDLIEEMEKYTADISGLDSIANRATRLNNPIFGNNHFSAPQIRDINPDIGGYWPAFCTMFYNTLPEAERKRRGQQPNTWLK